MDALLQLDKIHQQNQIKIMQKKLDILFVQPNGAKKIYQSLSADHSAIEPPIWAAMLANRCRSLGYGTAILDCEAERLDTDESAKQIKEANARIVCIVVYGQQPSSSSQNMSGAVETADKLKELAPDSKILFVGPHASALPYETLAEPSVDMICQNEGVYTISDLLKVTDLEDETQLKKVGGLGFKIDGNVTLNKISPIVARENLETDLPGMAWDLLPSINKYRTSGWHSWSNNSDKEPFASIYTSLGCPNKCSFCMINIISRTEQGDHISSEDSNKFRWWNPEFIIKQFDQIAAMGVKNIKIADELFVLSPQHFMRICEMLIERNYGFNIWAYSRIDTCRPKYLETLKKSGVNWLALGIENPNTKLRGEVHKDGFQEVKILDVIRDIQNAGINVAGNYIFGLPMDTAESMQETLDFALDNPTEMINFYSAMAYPGSPLHLTAKKKGWELPKKYEGYSQHSYETLNLSNDHLTNAQILGFRDKAWMDVHTSEKYLSLLESKFGPRARENVASTTAIKVKRRILGD